MILARGGSTDMAKPLVENKKQIQENLGVFEGYLHSPNKKQREFAFKKVLAGQNFIAYRSEKNLHFAPSRYIGHKNASIENYSVSKGNGGRTDTRISKILTHNHSINTDIEDQYFDFISRFKMGKPHDKKKKKHRKFWIFDKRINIVNRDSGEDDDLRKSYYMALARKNQTKFRRRIIEFYNGECAITKFCEPQILEAAHIKPFAEVELNTLSNGILLRVDLHRLFDSNLMGIHPTEYTVHFAPSCRADYLEHEGKNAFIPEGGPSATDFKIRWKEFEKAYL